MTTTTDLLGDETCEECETTGVNCALHRDNAAKQEALEEAATPTTFRSDAERATAQGLLLAAIANTVGHASSHGAKVSHIRHLLDRQGIHSGQVDPDGQPVPPPHDDDCRQCDRSRR